MSIIIPVYNGAEFIPAIIRYLCEQSYRDIHVYMLISSKCDDGSLSIAQSETERLDWVDVLTYEDTEALGGSKNFGIDCSDGEIIWFLDVDDIPSHEFLSEMIGIMEGYQADIVACNFMYSSDRTPLNYGNRIFNIDIMDGTEAVRLRSTEKFPVTSWSMLYRKELLIKNNIRFPNGLAEDILFTYRSLKASKKVCLYYKPLYKYYTNPNSVCNSPNTRNIRGNSEIARYNTLEKIFEDNDASDFLMSRFTLTRLRSAGHMSYDGFKAYVKSPQAREMVKRNRNRQVSFEGFLATRLSPLYYLMLRSFFRVFYYRSGRIYLDPDGGEIKYPFTEDMDDT